MRNILFVLTFSLITSVSFSQTNVLVHAGTSNAIFLSSLQNLGFNAGALVDIPFSKNWSIQTGINVNSYEKEMNSSISHFIDGQSVDFDEGFVKKFNFMEFPVAVSRKMQLSPKLNLYVNSGAYMAVFLGGSTLLRSSSGFSDYALVETYADPIHLGLLLGIGIEINKVYIGFEGNSYTSDGLAADAVFKAKIGFRF